ncbi:MAG: hypothetical protein IJW49_00690 [Clostridia bacterium]|nr:hypothetical protein [Clostridia bacterium]
MRRGYRRRKRRIGRGMLVVLLLLLSVFLVSCVAGSDMLWLRDIFGVDVVNYDEEPTVQTCATDGDAADQLADMLQSLTTANSLSLPTFDTPSQAVTLYRDAILNDLLRENYLLYTGNNSVLSSVPAAYPGRTITTLIPGTDFESAATRYFGTSSVRHKDGEVFEYLDRADGYTAPLQAWVSGVDVRVDAMEETEHTYRMTFCLVDGWETSEQYLAVFAKRDGGSCYLYSLSRP